MMLSSGLAYKNTTSLQQVFQIIQETMGSCIPTYTGGKHFITLYLSGKG